MKAPSWRWQSALRIIVPIVAGPVFLTAAVPTYSPTQRLLAWALFSLATAPALRLLERPVSVPILELVGLQYAVLYALPVFYQEDLKIGQVAVTVKPSAITLTLGITALACVYILLGFEVARRSFRLNMNWLKFEPSASRMFAYGVLLTVASVAVLFTPLGAVVGAGPMEVLFPKTLGLSILACLYYGGRLDSRRRFVVIGLFALSVAWGLIAGMMEGAVQPFLIWAIARFVYTRRAPIVAGSVVVAMFFILQPIKIQYRNLMGAGLREFTAAEALGVYGRLVATLWRGVGTDQGAVATLATQSASERLSWLLSTARYVEMTPDFVPYHGGRTLLYPFYSVVPRVVWPNKPLAQEANKVLPVEYGFQSPETLDKTMFGVGHIAEVFTAFGFVGIMPVFFLIGMAYAVPGLVLKNAPNVAGIAMLIWLATTMMHVGGTIGGTLGGVLQQIVVQGIAIRAITRMRGDSHSHAVPASFEAA